MYFEYMYSYIPVLLQIVHSQLNELSINKGKELVYTKENNKRTNRERKKAIFQKLILTNRCWFYKLLFTD